MSLTPDKIQDFTECVESFIRRTCDAEAERIKIKQEVNYQTAKLSWDFIVSVGGKIGTGVQAVMQELEKSFELQAQDQIRNAQTQQEMVDMIIEAAGNTFGAGATSINQIRSKETAIISLPSPLTFTIGEKEVLTVVTIGDSSKPISFYAQKRVDSILLSSAGLKLNISDFSLALNLGAENIGISGSIKNDDVTNSVALTVNLTKLKVGIEQSHTIDMGNGINLTEYSNISLNGLSLLYAYCMVVFGSDISQLQPALT